MTVDNTEASRASIGTRRFGYAIVVGINVLLVVVVNNILSWGWLPWLTPGFEKLLPVINLALGVNIVLNLLYMARDGPPFKSRYSDCDEPDRNNGLGADPPDLSVRLLRIRLPNRHLSHRPLLGSRGSPRHRLGHPRDGHRRRHRDSEALPSFRPDIATLMFGA